MKNILLPSNDQSRFIDNAGVLERSIDRSFLHLLKCTDRQIRSWADFLLFRTVLPIAFMFMLMGAGTPDSLHIQDRGPLVKYQDGELVMIEDYNGDRIPDFSYVGYHHSSKPIPDVETVITLEPSEGNEDDRARIQAAIDEVSQMPPNEFGHRGAVLLKAGTWWVDWQLQIRAPGVVLRGEGQGQDGTVVVARGTSRRYLIDIRHPRGGSGVEEITSTRTEVVDERVPVGSHRIRVEDSSGFEAGDQIIVHRRVNDDWMALLGMDQFGPETGTSPWGVSTYSFNWYREVVAVEDDTIVIDAPVVLAIDQRFGGGRVSKGDPRNFIEEVGVEHMRLVSDFEYHPRLRTHDEDHSWGGIEMNNVKNAWVRNVTGVHFAHGTVRLETQTQNITVMDNANLDMVSELRGSRRNPFVNSGGQQNLFIRNYSETGRHCFTLGARSRGPNVFVDNRAELAHNSSEPHHRYSHGILYDNVLIFAASTGAGLMIANRGDSGSGHGWSGAWGILWNSGSQATAVSEPPTARNMIIGFRETERSEQAITDKLNWLTNRTSWFDLPYNLELTRHEERDILYLNPHMIAHVDDEAKPRSLFLEQLRQRLGDEAVEAITIPAQRDGDQDAITAHLKQMGERDGPEVISQVFTSSSEDEYVPVEFRLYQSYPNPFNPVTNISYSLGATVDVKLNVYNVQGQKIATLVDKNQGKGEYTVQFDASGFSSGVYFLRMEAADFRQTKAITLIK